jgi:hypothetical protein
VTVCTSKQVSAYGPGARATQHAIIALDVGTVRESNGAHGTLTELAHTCHTRMYGATVTHHVGGEDNSHKSLYLAVDSTPTHWTRAAVPIRVRVVRSRGVHTSSHASMTRVRCAYSNILHRHSQHSLANNMNASDVCVHTQTSACLCKARKPCHSE